jgi:hypothetical protein
VILPSQEECKNIVSEALTFDDQLTEWEYEFVHNNEHCGHFSTAMQEACWRIAKDYDMKCYKVK